jgi:phage tail sheath protein FI
MANVLLSPGVLPIENDQSFIRQQPVNVGAAIIGPTVKGPVELPTIVTSYSDFEQKFGGGFLSGSDNYSYFTSRAVQTYFTNQGQSMLIARVVHGDYTSATSTPIINGFTSSSFTLETISEGAIMNSGTASINSALVSGSTNNIRFTISNSSTASGQFTLQIRQGNDTDNSPVPLETFINLSLDPYSPNFITRVIGDYKYNYNPFTNQITVSGSYPNASSFVRVKSVNYITPNYINNNGVVNSAYTSSIPINQSGSFDGAQGDIIAGAKFGGDITNTNSQGLVADDYVNMVNLLSNQDDYRFNMLITPGLIKAFPSHSSLIDTIISNTQQRGDNIYILDLVTYNSTEASVIQQALSIDSSYVASYWPWCSITTSMPGQSMWVPASTMIAGVYAYNDKVSEPWFAPAGINRGGLSTVIAAEQRLNQSSRDNLYQNKVNPIATFPGQGIVVYGQKTLQSKASALDRVNVRRLLIALKSYISQVANALVFEQNTIVTRNSFLSQVNPYLSSVQQRQGLYAFKVVMDDSNNTPDVIDRNQLVGQIYLQPTKTAEFVYLTFNITPTGTTFG